MYRIFFPRLFRYKSREVSEYIKALDKRLSFICVQYVSVHFRASHLL